MPFRTSFGLSAFQSQLGKLVIMPSVARNCSSNINKMGDTSNSQSMEREINARSTLNLEEVDKFRVMAQNWWDPQVTRVKS